MIGDLMGTGFCVNLQLSEAEAGFDMQFSQKDNPRDKEGQHVVTAADDLSPWWRLLKEAVAKAGWELGMVEYNQEPQIASLFAMQAFQGLDSQIW
ncbi:unnamed protein product [Sphagnum jensenii]|uniref:Uncharacterized protein n=1 Tax=Sphagnum jensenii TaxID=128206 RepID=A0ABP0VEC8_9BRYO